MNKYLPIQEAYFGKSKNLLEGEEVISKIIKQFKCPLEKVPKRVIKAAELNSSPLNKKLQDAFVKEFGFAECIIHWDGSPVANAYSFARGFMKMVNTGMPNLPVKQGERYYDSTHSYLCVVNVYAGLIDLGMNAEEIMAIILHEIGHNFQCTPSTTLTVFLDFLWGPVFIYNAFKTIKDFTITVKSIKNLYLLKKVLEDSLMIKAANVRIIMQFLIGMQQIAYLYDYTREALKSLILSYYVETAQERYKEAFKEFDEYILNNKNKITNMWQKYVRDYLKIKNSRKNNNDLDLRVGGFVFSEIIWDLAFSPTPLFIKKIYDTQSGYSGEVFADSFATAYGYGEATSSCEVKFEQLKLDSQWKYLNKDNSHCVFNQYQYLMLSYLRTLFTDPHPMSQTRIKNQINKLYRDLEEEDLDPKVKAMILKDIEKCEKQYQIFLSLGKDYQHLTIIQSWYRINEIYFGGKVELRDHVNRLLNGGSSNSEA